VFGILEQPGSSDRIDAVLLLDAMHTGLMPDGVTLNPAGLAPFEEFAQRAMTGNKLFVLTHSNIEPIGYAGVAQSANLMLQRLGVERTKVSGETHLPPIDLMGIVPRKDVLTLKPRTLAASGSLFVKGYGGNEPAEHMPHLVARWAAKP
jgi:hypothetical protein